MLLLERRVAFIIFLQLNSQKKTFAAMRLIYLRQLFIYQKN